MAMGGMMRLCRSQLNLHVSCPSTRSMAWFACAGKPPMLPWKELVTPDVIKNKSNREVGCDYEHWRIYTKPLRGYPTTHEIIRYYLGILSQVTPSPEEALRKLYSAALKDYYAFGANVSVDQADMLRDVKNVVDVCPDKFYIPPVTYPHVVCRGPDGSVRVYPEKHVDKRYPWEPVINGQVQVVPNSPVHYPVGRVASLTDENLGIKPGQIVDRQYAEWVTNGPGVTAVDEGVLDTDMMLC